MTTKTLDEETAGAWSPDDVSTALEARNRAACGPVCPPQGLYLAGVGYPADPRAKEPSIRGGSGRICSQEVPAPMLPGSRA